MALDIIIVSDESKPYWEDSKALRFGDVDPTEWESLMFKEFNIMTYFEYLAKGVNPQTYLDYYAEQISLLEGRYPMISRIKSYYEHASFSEDEVQKLKIEMESLKTAASREKSKRLLCQLIKACDLAIRNNCGISLIAD